MARPLPQDLDEALAASPAARDRFAALPRDRMAEWVHWVERTRLPTRRRRRVAETVRTFTPVAETTVNGGGPVEPPRDIWAVWLLALALLAAVVVLVLWFAVLRDGGASKTSVPRLVGVSRAIAES